METFIVRDIIITMTKRIILISILCIIGSINLLYSNGTISLEKLYLHIDRTYYYAGERVWFRGYLSPGTISDTLDLSKFIYVELLDNNNVISRVKIKGKEGIYAGSLVLPADLKEGFYIVRAYTRQQAASCPGCEYYTSIKIKELSSKKGNYIICNNNEKNNDYTIDFYPESGCTLFDIPNNVGFVVKQGNGVVEMEGELVDDNDSLITPVRTTYGGMGRFSYTPSKGKNYYIRFFGNSTVTHHQLPNAKEYGGIIRTNWVNDKLLVDFIYKGKPSINNHTFKIQWFNGLSSETLQEYNVNNEEKLYKGTILLQDNSLQEGVNALRMTNSLGEVLCERTVYNIGKTNNRISTTIAVNRLNSSQDDKYELTVKVCDKDGKPIESSFSIAIVKGSLYKHQQHESIETYMKLASEISSSVFRVDKYLDNDIPLHRRKAMLDLLMQTRNFHRYGLTAHKMNIATKELSQTIEGVVKYRSGKVAPGSLVCLFDASNGKSIIDNADINGSFVFDNLDYYHGNEFVLTATLNNGKKNVRPELLEYPSAPIIDYWNMLLESRKAATDRLSDTNANIVQDDTLLESIGSGLSRDTLPAAVITSNNGFIRLDPTKVPLGNTFERSRVKTRKDMEKYDYMNIMDYILANFNGITRIDDIPGGRLVSTRTSSIKHIASKMNGGSVTITSNPISVYIDGFKTDWSEASFLSIAQIENLVVLRPIETLLYRSAGGVVLIELKKTSLARNKEKDYNVLIVKPFGYQKENSFDEDNYSANTLFWSPCVKTNKEGIAKIEFKNKNTKDKSIYINIQGVAGRDYFSSIYVKQHNNINTN